MVRKAVGRNGIGDIGPKVMGQGNSTIDLNIPDEKNCKHPQTNSYSNFKGLLILTSELENDFMCNSQMKLNLTMRLMEIAQILQRLVRYIYTVS
jgi:hypothetical protein